ncbi:MAG TPA: hypothetical protein VGF86_12270 [Candidatus Tumulicola sp.]
MLQRRHDDQNRDPAALAVNPRNRNLDIAQRERTRSVVGNATLAIECFRRGVKRLEATGFAKRFVKLDREFP